MRQKIPQQHQSPPVLCFLFLHRYNMLPDYHYSVISQDCQNTTMHFLKRLRIYGGGVDWSCVMIFGEHWSKCVSCDHTEICGLNRSCPDQGSGANLSRFTGHHLSSFQQDQNNLLFNWYLLLTLMFTYFGMDLSWWDTIVKGAWYRNYIPPDAWKKYRKWLNSDHIPKSCKKKDHESVFWAS